MTALNDKLGLEYVFPIIHPCCHIQIRLLKDEVICTIFRKRDACFHVLTYGLRSFSELFHRAAIRSYRAHHKVCREEKPLVKEGVSWANMGII